MPYITESEYFDFGFSAIQNFQQQLTRASLVIDQVTFFFYTMNDLESDYPWRRDLVKRAIAYQIDYLDRSGIMTAQDKSMYGTVRIGRTTVESPRSSSAQLYADSLNLSIDALNCLKSAGFGYSGVSYDR